MLDTIISKDDFVEHVQIELCGLLESAPGEYGEDLQDLAVQFTGQYYKYLNATDESEQKRAQANISHIKAALAHISARIGLDIMERIIKICSTVLSIAVAAAIKAII